MKNKLAIAVAMAAVLPSVSALAKEVKLDAVADKTSEVASLDVTTAKNSKAKEALPKENFASSCDAECQSSRSYNAQLDELNRQIGKATLDLQLLRINQQAAEIKNPPEPESSTAEQAAQQQQEMNDKISALRDELIQRIQSLQAAQKSAEVKEPDNPVTYVPEDKSGIENVFITATKSIGTTWKATVYYNNGIEDLMEGDDVFPGAVITKIDSRGAVVSMGGKKYQKRITSSDVAYARSFNNLKEENIIRATQINRSGESESGSTQFMPSYEGY